MKKRHIDDPHAFVVLRGDGVTILWVDENQMAHAQFAFPIIDEMPTPSSLHPEHLGEAVTMGKRLHPGDVDSGEVALLVPVDKFAQSEILRHEAGLP
jgi:hypothetical protein